MCEVKNTFLLLLLMEEGIYFSELKKKFFFDAQKIPNQLEQKYSEENKRIYLLTLTSILSSVPMEQKDNVFLMLFWPLKMPKTSN